MSKSNNETNCNVKPLRGRVIGDVWVGDCEGNHKKHALFITLEEDEYEVISVSDDGMWIAVELTEKGHEHYKNYDNLKWSTNYYNYTIYVFDKFAAKVSYYNKMLDEKSQLQKDIDLFYEYISGKWD